jgi:glycosyltransferase involved in cell wall biosynthesis
MHVAGAEVLVAEIVRQLAGEVLSTIFCLDAVGPLGEGLRAEGVDVICLGRRPGRDLRVGLRLARESRLRGIELLHAHQYTPFFYAALAKMALGRSRLGLIFTEHGRHFPDVVPRLRRAVNRVLLARITDRVTAVSDFSRQSLARNEGFGDWPITVIENGIEVERYGSLADRAAQRDQAGLDPTRRYVAAVARFHPVKDHATLLHGFSTVAAVHPETDLLLVGDGPLRGELERLVRELGIEARVRFLGVRSDVADLLRAADVFALTSLSEAASLTLLEAMASSVPVVVTAVGGNSEIVRDGVDGLLVPRRDAVAVGRALATLLRDPATAQEMGAAGRARVEARYRLETTIAAYRDLYRSTSRRRRHR